MVRFSPKRKRKGVFFYGGPTSGGRVSFFKIARERVLFAQPRTKIRQVPPPHPLGNRPPVVASTRYLNMLKASCPYCLPAFVHALGLTIDSKEMIAHIGMMMLFYFYYRPRSLWSREIMHLVASVCLSVQTTKLFAYKKVPNCPIGEASCLFFSLCIVILAHHVTHFYLPRSETSN